MFRPDPDPGPDLTLFSKIRSGYGSDLISKPDPQPWSDPHEQNQDPHPDPILKNRFEPTKKNRL